MSPLQVYLGEAHANPVCISTIIQKLFHCDVSRPGLQVTSTELEEKYRHQIELAWNCRKGSDFNRLSEVREFFGDVEERVAAAALLGTFDQEAVRSILNRFGGTVSEQELSLDEVTWWIKIISSLQDRPIEELIRAIDRHHNEHLETFYRLVTFNDGGCQSLPPSSQHCEKQPGYSPLIIPR
jgi:hypothetical protein